MSQLMDLSSPELILEDGFGEKGVDLLKRVGLAAECYGVECYLVGGLVRDLLLRRRSSDVDLMVDADLEGFLDFLLTDWQIYLGGYPVPQDRRLFAKFLTAKLTFNEEVLPSINVIDFSQSRQETYPSPGGQPVVAPGDLAQDMARRDFSVNALALKVGPKEFGKVEDTLGGLNDLERRELRLLHAKSLVDDPARILRGIRLETRLGFSFAKETMHHIQEAVAANLLTTLPPFRLCDETVKALNDFEPWSFLRRAAEIQAIDQIFPGSGLSLKRIDKLAHLEWFAEIHGNVEIANRDSWEALYALCYVYAPQGVLAEWLTRARIKGVGLKRILSWHEELTCKLSS